ncbi:TPA: ferrous iron transport protein B [Candidatus Sumerlaeota bacterium]|jgi:ferrous iron transport protein B|nr:ferrous iron transport protein B [Candidatus Sumerlaeota bacterium]
MDTEGPGKKTTELFSDDSTRHIILCGPPNVGKSMIFNCLTGRYAAVSNYPGTTVEISSGRCTLLPGYEASDTPGAYSLLPISDEERVTRDILLNLQDALVVHVVDAKNLRRMLPMTLELRELGLPMMLVLNMMDEARQYGVEIDTYELSLLLQIPVVATTAIKGTGIPELCRTIQHGDFRPKSFAMTYDNNLRVMAQTLGLTQPEGTPFNPTLLAASPAASALPLNEMGAFELAVRKTRQAYADDILASCAIFPPRTVGKVASVLGRLTFNVWTGVPIALLVLYFGVYKFVGQFGAGTLVNFLEKDLFEKYVTPHLTRWVEALLPWPILQDLFVHDFGMLTLGLRYAIALILPIVGTFFLFFSMLEDSGYLPRLALLLDRVFKRIGLNGRAVIPIILGFGCGTMAVMVTRILETKRERIIATLLLGMAIPCSAQLGVILGMLAGHPTALLAWAGVITVIFLGLGWLGARHLPGEAPAFYLEMPPLRLPKLANIVTKTYSRMHWYFLEILPLFVAVSALIWIGNITGVFQWVIHVIQPLIGLMGLPPETASAFLFGFFRRDYAAAGLLDLQRNGLLNAHQTFVSVLVITLFLPCVAQFFVMKKERGWKFTLATSATIMVAAALAGIISNFILTKTGWM